MISKEKIESSILPVLQNNGVIRHSVKVFGNNPPTVEISIDNQTHNVDLELCEKVSREISDVLDSVDTSNDAYMLDVCSYGAERELIDDDDIRANVNAYVHIDLVNPKAGLDKVEGTLMRFDEGQLTVSYMAKNIKKQVVIDRDNVRFIRLAVKL